MVDREMRATLSTAAWVCAFLCGIALATSAMALANSGPANNPVNTVSAQ